MKHLWPRLASSLVLLLLAILFIALAYLPAVLAEGPEPLSTAETTTAQAQQEPPPAYTDDETFNKLSGAARTLLELKYGKKESGPAITGAGTDSPIGPFTAIDNLLSNDPTADPSTQDTQSETAIVLAGSTLVAAWNDSGSLIFGGSNKFTGYGRSTNSGGGWTDGGALPANARGDAGDPVLAYSASLNRTYLATLNFFGSGLRIFHSNDGAATWLPPVEGAPGFGSNDFLDKEWLAVDNFTGVGNGNIYHVFRNFPGGEAGSQPGGIYLTRSTDGGVTFGPSGGILVVPEGAINVQGAYAAVGPDHAVYVFWYDQNLTPKQIRVRKSTDLGLTFGISTTVASLNGVNTNGDLGLNGGFRTNSFPHAAVNPVSGHVYVVYNDDPAGADEADVFFSKSSDGGATWSLPVSVNDDSTTNDQFMPTLAVTPDGTRLAISFYDRRLDPANNLIDRFAVVGAISGSTVTFDSNFRLTNTSFPVVIGVDPAVNTTYIGDYDMIAADNNFFYLTWSDNRDQSLIVPTRKNANVRFAKVPVNNPGAILRLAAASLAPGCGNGNGAIDFNECNQLNLALRNEGTGPATGVTASLATGTPNVSITQPNAAYADLASGATVTNTTLFSVSTSATFTPGTTIAFTLTVNTASDGVFILPFSLPSGLADVPVRFDNNTPVSIPEFGAVFSDLPVSGITAPVANVTVSLYLAHTFDADLEIFLVGPDGTEVELTTANGGAGDNYGTACSPDSNRTTFDDAATTSIVAGLAPFAGTFRPEGSLADFAGKSGPAINGTWTLRINDKFFGDAGVLQCWSLVIAPITSVDGGGVCTRNVYLPFILK